MRGVLFPEIIATSPVFPAFPESWSAAARHFAS